MHWIPTWQDSRFPAGNFAPSTLAGRPLRGLSARGSPLSRRGLSLRHRRRNCRALSRTAPRRGRYAKVFIAVLVYVVYYNLGGMAQTWLEEGWVGALPGMMWVHTLPASMLLVLLWWPVRPPWWRNRMASLRESTARVLRR